MQYSTWQSAGKGLKLHGGFWGPGGTCFAQVLKPSKCSISTWQGKGKGRWQSAGKGLKLHGRVWGPGGTCLFWNPLNAEFRPGKAAAKGERCTGGFRVLVKRAWRRCGNRVNAIFDLAKRRQQAKAARRVLGPWWNVLRAGFETFSKCRISTWQGRGKGWKVLRRVSCPSETCLAQVWKPSKCNIRSGKALAKG